MTDMLFLFAGAFSRPRARGSHSRNPDIIDNATPKLPVPPQQPHPSQTARTSPTMAPSQTLYPRATVKRIVKAHSNRPLSKNADIMVNK